jgi:galactonate dehydratase
VKTFGVSLTPTSDRPYVFVKLETNAGIVGWGEATLEGKAGAAIACVNDLKEFILGADPMAVEHHSQDMYIHTFYRGGPVIGSAISGIDQALWDIRGKMLGLPVWELLGGPHDPRGVRGYYDFDIRYESGEDPGEFHDELSRLSEEAKRQELSAFKTDLPEYYEWIDTRAKVGRAVSFLQMIREGMGPDVGMAVDFHAKTSPTVASEIIHQVEPLNLLFVEEPCPPENVRAMARVSKRSATPIATGERLVGPYSCRELIEAGVIDILQTDVNHVGGITALWKVGAMAAAGGVLMAPHACEGPIGSLASLHVDAAMPNFLVQETCGGLELRPEDKVWEEWFGFPVMRLVHGRFPLPEKPGLGFELTEEQLRKFPFGGTRPMARVFFEDGSVAEW